MMSVVTIALLCTLDQSMINYGSSVIAAPLRKGRPFQAEFDKREVGHDGQEQLERGSIAVASSLQTRAEIVVLMAHRKARTFAWISDPKAGRMRVFDVATGAVLSDSPHPGSPDSNSEESSDWPEGFARVLKAAGASWQHLGVRTIEGLICEGFQLSRSGDSGDASAYEAELWVSKDLGQVVLEQKKTAKTTTYFRMFNIRLGEPSPSVFTIARPMP